MWFKSKTQHSDPDVRRRYVEQLPGGDDMLLTVALEDPHPEVRSAAVARLQDLPALQQLSADDPDPQIRARSTARLQTVLAGGAELEISLDARLSFVESCANQKLYAYLARSAAEPELRKEALTRLLPLAGKNEIATLLCDVAVEDPVGDIRELAAAQIVEEPHLSTLVQRSKGRDKSIYRQAHERLGKIQALTAATAALTGTSDEAHTLGASNLDLDSAVAEARLASLRKTWQANRDIVGDSLDSAVQKRYDEAVAFCEQYFENRRAQRNTRREILDALQSYLDQQSDESPVSELSRRWHEQGEPTPAESREFDRLVHEAHALQSQHDRDEERVAAAEKAIAACERAVVADKSTEKDVQRLEKRWDALLLPDDAAIRQTLSDRYQAARQKLLNRLKDIETKQAAQLELAAGHLDAYEKALSAEKLKEVLAAHHLAAEALSRFATTDARAKALRERLRAGEPRMSELKRWRHWATIRVREELCERAESLPVAGLTPPAMARAVRDCRDAWKALDKTDGAASKALWERFDKACEQAYEPCQAYFDEQKRGRQGNLAARVVLCERLETLATETDWDNPPWRELADSMRDTQRKWQRTGAVDRREKSAIETRFKSACKVIDDHLQAMRDRELQRRQTLIESIESISADDDLNAATRRVKFAQRDWKPLVQADRRTERELWTRFRSACDAVFEQRKKHHEKADQERLQHLAEKKSVCNQVEDILSTLKAAVQADEYDAAMVDGIRKKIAALRNGWQRIGPVPRNEQDRIEQRVRTAANDVLKLCDELDDTLKRRAHEQLSLTAQQCDAWAFALTQGQSVDETIVQQQIDGLADGPLKKTLTKRLRQVAAGAAGDAAALDSIRAALNSNLQEKLTICLELEIAAGIDSPPEFQQERMAYRVNQLSASLSGQARQRDATQLQQDWYATGAVVADQQQSLEQRFQRAVSALDHKR